jgi:hypothetical protein
VVAVSAVEETPLVATEAGPSPTKERPPSVAEDARPPAPGAGRRAPAGRSAPGVQRAPAGRRVPKERTPASLGPRQV